MKVKADYGLCEANAVCMGLAPEVFEVDEQDNLYILQEDVSPENEAKVRDAVRLCPRQALSITD